MTILHLSYIKYKQREGQTLAKFVVDELLAYS
jgi:hypothetical protein